MSVAVGDKATADWANHRPASASGTVNITTAALNTPVSASITFPTGRFATAPAVSATIESTTPQAFAVGVASRSKTGATIYLNQATGTVGTRTVNWTAVEQT